MAHSLLLADDNITTHRVVELTFAGHDVRVISVLDGPQAIDKLSSERPDIVLAGVSLPKIDGYELARFVNSQPSLQGVPVVLLTGAFDSVDEQRMRESGAVGVLVKPFEPGIVISRVKELLGIGSKPEPRAVPAGSRLVTAHEPMPARPVGPGPTWAAPSALAPERVADPAPWDQLRQETGLSPDTRPVEGQAAGSDDYFEQLDAAFDTLDAHLASKGAPQGRAVPVRPMRMPAAIDPAARSSMLRRAEPDAGAPESEPLAFEVDRNEFGGGRDTIPEPGPVAPATRPEPLNPASPPLAQVSPVPAPPFRAPPHEPEPAHVLPTASDRPSAAASPDMPRSMAPAPTVERSRPDALAEAYPPQTHHGAQTSEVPPPQGRAGAPSSRMVQAVNPSVADAFDVLLAAEQGEPGPPPPAFEISDAVVERIASRVAERLSEGLLIDTVTEIVTEVSERLVREEIARIRAAAQARKG